MQVFSFGPVLNNARSFKASPNTPSITFLLVALQGSLWRTIISTGPSRTLELVPLDPQLWRAFPIRPSTYQIWYSDSEATEPQLRHCTLYRPRTFVGEADIEDTFETARILRASIADPGEDRTADSNDRTSWGCCACLPVAGGRGSHSSYHTPEDGECKAPKVAWKDGLDLESSKATRNSPM